jgi:hydroxysqualene dehydroxylase
MIDVAVIGGGLAGLAAAVDLAGKGRSVALFEARPQLGGRAWSFPDASGDDIDNGQHLLMGCYSSTLGFLRALGTERLLERMPRMAIPFRKPGGTEASLKTGALPHPFGLMQAFLGYEFLSMAERLSVLRVAVSLRGLSIDRLDALDAMSATEWLEASGQSAHAIEMLWLPIVLATMNTDVHDASAKLLAVVLREIFLGGADASALLLPARGLSDIFSRPAAVFLEARGARVRTHAPVRRCSVASDGITVHLDGEEACAARAVISALPPWSLRALEGYDAQFGLTEGQLERFRPSPILSAHVWSRVKISAQPMTGLLGTRLQWIFSKGKSADGLFRSSCTISAAQEIDGRATEEIEPLIKKELCLLYPALRDGDIVRTKLVRERTATFIPSPGMEAHRPGVVGGLPGFFLAGDWTDTGLPATIEGAVRSGERAASAADEFLRRT